VPTYDFEDFLQEKVGCHASVLVSPILPRTATHSPNRASLLLRHNDMA